MDATDITLETLTQWTLEVFARACAIYSVADKSKNRIALVPADELEPYRPVVKSFRSRRWVGLCTFDRCGGADKILYDVGKLRVLGVAQAMETVIHEVAHVVTYWLYPGENHVHDQAWRDVCIALGGVPTRLVRPTPEQCQAMKALLPEKRRSRWHLWEHRGEPVYVQHRPHVRALRQGAEEGWRCLGQSVLSATRPNVGVSAT